MAKSAAAVYAQMRRDNEIEARDTLQSLIPEKYFTMELSGRGDYNMSTKVFIAAKAYMQETSSGQQAIEEAAHQQKNAKDELELTPFSIPPNGTAQGSMNEQIRQLRQVASRLVQKAEEKSQTESGMSPELMDAINIANDLMIDTIRAIEKA